MSVTDVLLLVIAVASLVACYELIKVRTQLGLSLQHQRAAREYAARILCVLMKDNPTACVNMIDDINREIRREAE